jgi:uncharacterized protein (TIGR00299 family) protein
MTKALYFDLQHGLSGDMMLAALLACCDDPQAAAREVEAVALGDRFRLALQHVQRSSIDTLHVDVLNDHGEVAEAAAHAHTHTHSHRHLRTILDLINGAALNDRVKGLAGSVFQRLGEAEAAAHNIDIEQVHFHEVGALDSMVDIVGTCLLFDKLKLDSLLFNDFHFGSGTVEADHGILPLPVPAVARLTEGYRVRGTDIAGELITPTAAALLTGLGQQVDQTEGRLLKSLFVSGTKHYAGTPGFVRASLLEVAPDGETSTQYVIAVNLDDISGERIAFALERALAAGARDAWAEQILMKKGRPAVKLCVMTDSAHRDALERQLLSDTHAWGLRTTVIEKRELPRQEKEISTPYGNLQRKTGTLPDGSTHHKWAWDDIVALAQDKEIPINDLLRRLAREISDA